MWGRKKKVGIALSGGAARKYEDLADIVIEPEVGDFGFFDLTHGSETIKRGKEAAEAKAMEIKRKLRLK